MSFPRNSGSDSETSERKRVFTPDYLIELDSTTNQKLSEEGINTPSFSERIIQSPLFDFEAFIATKSNDRLVLVLEALDAEKLIVALERENWTGRKGYSIRGMWCSLIAGLLYQCYSLAAVVRLLEWNKDVRIICGFSRDNIPS